MKLTQSIFAFSLVLTILTSLGNAIRRKATQLPSFLTQAQGGYAISLGRWNQAQPIFAEIVRFDGSTSQVTSNYQKWQPETQTATSTLTTKTGTVLVFNDTLSVSSDELVIQRTVTVQAVGKGDTGFSTRFSLQSTTASNIADSEFFLPGVWYRNNKNAKDRWYGRDQSAKYVLVREDRTPYPIIMARNPSTSSWGALVHLNPNGATFEGDSGRNRIIDARIQYGSIGVINNGNLELAYQFPAAEGSTTSVGGLSNNAWMLRSHPLTKGLTHSYQLAFLQQTGGSFADAVETSWRYAFDSYKPQPPSSDRSQVYKASVELLGTYIGKYNNISSVPFLAFVPNGTVKDTSSQMGFVGKATLSAAYLMAASLNQTTVQIDKINSTWLQNAIDIVDFWVNNSMNPSGVPKVWYDIRANGNFDWRPYNSHIRVVSDGMMGVLMAWKLMNQTNLNKLEWMAYCRKFGDFLVKNQYSEGSFAGVWWGKNGTAAFNYTNTAHHAIPFLVELYKATGDETYKNCALRAGEFTYNNAHMDYQYSGGAADNPNVLDKEAGVLAFEAFMSLFELTKEDKWLTGAKQAATYCETWTYIWDVPMLSGEGYNFPSQKRTVLGGSLIASGQSGVDNYMAATVHLYKRLADYSCDNHYNMFSYFLGDATAQLLDWDGQLGYKYKGLLPEAYSVVGRGKKGVQAWLPWLTTCVLEPFMSTDVVTSSCKFRKSLRENSSKVEIKRRKK